MLSETSGYLHGYWLWANSMLPPVLNLAKSIDNDGQQEVEEHQKDQDFISPKECRPRNGCTGGQRACCDQECCPTLQLDPSQALRLTLQTAQGLQVGIYRRVSQKQGKAGVDRAPERAEPSN